MKQFCGRASSRRPFRPRHAAIPLLLVCLFLFSAHSSWAEPSTRKLTRKRLELGTRDIGGAANDSQGQLRLDEILTESVATDVYDPLTLSALRRVRDDAQPPWNAEDIDPDLTRRAVERAYGIQSIRTLSRLIDGSELRPAYRAIRSALSQVTERFRYSLQDDGDGLEVSRATKGRKLLELNLELNAKQGLDPQLRFGDDVRLRYDYINKRTILEYAVTF